MSSPALPSLAGLAGLALLVLALTPVMIAYARRVQLEDVPGPRSSHLGRIPRGGGALAILVLVFSLLWSWPLGWPSTALPLCLGALALIGWWDDHQPQPVRRRLLVQACCAFVLSLFFLASTWSSATLETTYATLLQWLTSSVWAWPGLAFATLAGVWLINLYNFMDGSHGLAAGEAIFTGAASYWLLYEHAPAAASLGGLLAAVMLGFLPWNFPRPWIFMGDVASGVLGLSVAAIALLAGHQAWLVPLILSSIFITDTSLTLLDRIRRRQMWYQAHREHRYQRLIQIGWSHTAVWLAYMAVNLLFILPLAYWATLQPGHAWWALLITALGLSLLWLALGYWLEPRLQHAHNRHASASDLNNAASTTQPEP